MKFLCQQLHLMSSPWLRENENIKGMEINNTITQISGLKSALVFIMFSKSTLLNLTVVQYYTFLFF